MFRLTDNGISWIYDRVVSEEPSFYPRGVSATGDVVTGVNFAGQRNGGRGVTLSTVSKLCECHRFIQ